MKKRIKISAAIITKNSERTISSVLDSLLFADEIVVVDSGSTDATVSIAERYGARTYYKKWQGYAKQKNYAVSKCRGEWILSVDSDETVSRPLAAEISGAVNQGGAAGYFVPVETYCYPDRRLRFGGLYPNLHMRLFKKNKGMFQDAPVHECVSVKGKTGTLKKPLLHYTKDSIHSHMEAVNAYTELEAEIPGRTPTGYSIIIKPMLYFLKHYFLKAGFLDGIEGFVYHKISAYYIFIKEVKKAEKQGFDRLRVLKTIFKRNR
ncbi:MAG: glycosyltransferase family 2 protein [Candidatus Goldiibacteriota bacterium]